MMSLPVVPTIVATCPPHSTVVPAPAAVVPSKAAMTPTTAATHKPRRRRAKRSSRGSTFVDIRFTSEYTAVQRTVLMRLIAYGTNCASRHKMYFRRRLNCGLLLPNGGE